MTSTVSYSARIEALRKAINEADHIIIGAGSGLTTAAGIDYGGKDFRLEFAPWIERYGFTDLYTSSFYPFETKEEYWAYWAKHIWFSRYRTGATELYKMLLQRFMNAFVVTTNVDGQFELAGFPARKIFATQGDYRWFQPATKATTAGSSLPAEHPKHSSTTVNGFSVCYHSSKTAAFQQR